MGKDQNDETDENSFFKQKPEIKKGRKSKKKETTVQYSTRLYPEYIELIRGLSILRDESQRKIIQRAVEELYVGKDGKVKGEWLDDQEEDW